MSTDATKARFVQSARRKRRLGCLAATKSPATDVFPPLAIVALVQAIAVVGFILWVTTEHLGIRHSRNVRHASMPRSILHAYLM